MNMSKEEIEARERLEDVAVAWVLSDPDMTFKGEKRKLLERDVLEKIRVSLVERPVFAREFLAQIYIEYMKDCPVIDRTH